jgi:hypothetical protein
VDYERKGPTALARLLGSSLDEFATGATEWYSLAEFKEDARPVHKIRERYLCGLYGAILAVEKLSL